MRTPACGKCAPSSMLETIHENRCQVHVILLISTASARGDSGCVWRERARAIRFQKAARACSRPRAGQVAQQVVVSDSSDPTTVREAHACYIPATPQRRQRRRGAQPGCRDVGNHARKQAILAGLPEPGPPYQIGSLRKYEIAPGTYTAPPSNAAA